MATYSLLMVLAAAFIWLSAGSLPPRVAAHFDASGAANGFMPRDVYLIGVLSIGVALPLLLLVLTRVAIARPEADLRLPRSGYWLAPARRPATIAFIQAWIGRFGFQFALLACFVHGLIVRANRVDPPRLSNSPFYAALIVFGIALVVWINSFFNRFRSPE